MTEPNDVQVPMTPPPSGNEPSTPTPPGGPDTPSPTVTEPATPVSSPNPEWRAGDEAPPWARGKTPEEVLGIATQMYGTLEKFNQTGNLAPVPQPAAPQPAQPVAPPQYPAAPATPPQPVELSGEDYVTGGQVQQWAQQQMTAYQAQQQQAMTWQASMAQ